jgi:Icc protein
MRFLVLSLTALIFSCNLDGWGWLISSDVDDRYADNQSLLSPAGPSLTPSFSFVVIADTHVFSGTNTAARFAALASDIGLHGDSFVLACGDLVQNGALADYQAYAVQVVGPPAPGPGLGVPVYSVPGNHDLYNSGWTNFKSVLGRSMYTFAAGPVRVIAVDSANGTLGGPQRAWLENVLAARTEPLCVTFTHFEFFNDSITETQQWTDINEAYSLQHLFETSGVNIHFSGHTHSYFVRTINGMNYVTAPSLGNGAVRATVSGGTISWQAIDF